MEHSGFYNSVGGDRRYDQEFFQKLFGSFIGNGVFPNPSTNCQIVANDDMTITVKDGLAWINGVLYYNDSDFVLGIDSADAVLKRIDRIVLRNSTTSRSTRAYIKKGTFASSPVAPALKRDADMYELGIADIYIGNNAVSISQGNITDLRMNSNYCGVVHGLVDQVDTTTLFNQYAAWYEDKQSQFNTALIEYSASKQIEIDQTQAGFELDFATWMSAEKSGFLDWMNTEKADFLAWFNNDKDVLSSDAAGNLLTKIEELDSRTKNRNIKLRMGGI